MGVPILKRILLGALLASIATLAVAQQNRGMQWLPPLGGFGFMPKWSGGPGGGVASGGGGGGSCTNLQLDFSQACNSSGVALMIVMGL